MSDNCGLRTYAEAMESAGEYIELRLEVDQPVALSQFVGTFTAVAAEYERQAREVDPQRNSHATLYVSEVQSGSIIAHLVPILPLLPGLAEHLGAILTVEDFVVRWGARLMTYAKPGGRLPDPTKSQLADIVKQVAIVATNPDSRLKMLAIEAREGDLKIKAALEFNTDEARVIEAQVTEHRREIEHLGRENESRVLMAFTRSDTGRPAVGKSTGERVRIESLSDRPLPLIYASELAERAIKHEISEADDNVYKKGFVVDVNVENRNGKPAAYRVTALHQIIDIDDEA